MLELLRKPYPEEADGSVLAAYDAMKLEAAKAAAPYIHPRLANRDALIGIGPLAGDLAAQGRTVLEALAGGRITPNQAATVMQAISAEARIVEVDELKRRVAALEGKRDA